jgi:hypothetical protein
MQSGGKCASDPESDSTRDRNLSRRGRDVGKGKVKRGKS